MYKPIEGTLRVIRDHVIVSDMKFDRRITKGGIILPEEDGKDAGIRPRWGKVFAVGPEQKDVSEGQWILVAHGRWTRGINYSLNAESTPITIRRVDAKDIIAVSDEAPEENEL